MLALASESPALTASQIEELRQSGVSDETIQLMLQNERLRLQARAAHREAQAQGAADAAALEAADRAAAGVPPASTGDSDLPSELRAQIEASQHTGSFDLPDGSRIISTGDHPDTSKFANDGGWGDATVSPWVVAPPWQDPGPGPVPPRWPMPPAPHPPGPIGGGRGR